MTTYSHNELGAFFSIALKAHKVENFIEAEKYYTLILSNIPHHADTLHHLGLIKHKQKNNNEAISLMKSAMKYAPKDLSIAINIAIIYEEENQLDNALMLYKKVIQQAVKNSIKATAHCGLAGIYQIFNETTLFIHHSEKAYSLNPNDTKTLTIYASALKKTLQLYDSISILKQAHYKEPDNTVILSNLIATLYSIGNITEASIYTEQYNKQEKTSQSGINQQLFNCNYDPNLSLSSLFKKHKERAKLLPKHIVKNIHKNKHTKIRLGYCSSDFRFHSVAFFFQPIIENHDTDKFEIYCYYNNNEEDESTFKIKSHCKNWINIKGLTDQAAIKTIQEDEIDILIDLSGYSAGNRMGIFANRTTPIQISYLGYPNTTGLTTVDYRIVDNVTDPVGLTEKINTEILIRLDGSFLCYTPPDNCPDINQPPCIKNKYITFGSFNNMAKINDNVVKLWSDILLSVKDSKLLIKSSVFCDPKIVEYTLKRFKEYNISSEQLIFKAHKTDFTSHMETYNEIDIALDPFPYNGTTTTCEALWMGTPVIALLGKAHISRVSASILHTLSLNNLIAENSVSYKTIAISLAKDSDFLLNFGESIRQKMHTSKFTDGITFTHALEKIFTNLQHHTKK